jgi:DNA repair protein RadC
MMTVAQEDRAIRILEGRLQTTEADLPYPSDARNYVVARFAGRRSEVFAILFLNARLQLIECRELFQGTIDGATVYPREVVRAVIETNALYVVLVHNHPSGNPEPSDADYSITAKLVRALALIDVRVLDHLIVCGVRTTSLADRGRL